MAPVPYATSFEGVDNNPELGWFGLVKNWECPCPTATVTWNSAAAKRTGSAGVEIRVEVGGVGWVGLSRARHPHTIVVAISAGALQQHMLRLGFESRG